MGVGRGCLGGKRRVHLATNMSLVHEQKPARRIEKIALALHFSLFVDTRVAFTTNPVRHSEPKQPPPDPTSFLGLSLNPSFLTCPP